MISSVSDSVRVEYVVKDSVKAEFSAADNVGP